MKTTFQLNRDTLHTTFYTWSFLYDMNKTDENLKEARLKLEKKLTHDQS
jgi:hypothetical protein